MCAACSWASGLRFVNLPGRILCRTGRAPSSSLHRSAACAAAPTYCRIRRRSTRSSASSTTPLRRAGTPDDIASVVAFLLSANAAYMTGEVVSADGGASIVSSVRPSGGAGAWDYAAHDRALYGELARHVERGMTSP